MKKNIKDAQLKFRITNEEKEKIMNYCEKYSVSASEFCRIACESYLQRK